MFRYRYINKYNVVNISRHIAQINTTNQYGSRSLSNDFIIKSPFPLPTEAYPNRA